MRRLVPLLLLLALVVSGCISLPSSGEIRTEPFREQLTDETPVDFTPGGPRPGASPIEIASNFLLAMRATPLNTSVARQFLTAQSSESWLPEQGTVVYGGQTLTLAGQDVRLDLAETERLDERGAWQGETGDATYRLDMVREGGQWRISAPPDRLIIPTDHFETRFQQYYLYFFDKASEVLVPEPVYVPTGAQATTYLVDGLLAGPGRELLGVERTYLPARTQLDDISVPVTADGTAEVPLSDHVLDLDPQRMTRAFAQIAWTLRQVSGIQRMRVTVDGSPLELPGQGPDVPIDAWSEYDPAVAWASQSLFGVRDGHVITLIGGEERRVSGAFGSLDLGLRRIAVDLAGEKIASTTRDGRVLVAARSRDPGATPDAADAREVYAGGTDLLAPSWDLHGVLWLLDRTTGGAELHLVRDGVAREVEVAGLTGEDVSALIVSRDGTRVVAQVTRDDRDSLVQARVQRDQEGRIRAITAASPLRVPDLSRRRVLDLAWRSPGTVAVLTAPFETTSQVLTARVDGSSTLADATGDAEVFRGPSAALVTSPVTGAPVLLRTPGGDIYSLTDSGRWAGSGISAGLRSPTFVG